MGGKPLYLRSSFIPLDLKKKDISMRDLKSKKTLIIISLPP
jgi:hypothetical protein